MIPLAGIEIEEGQIIGHRDKISRIAFFGEGVAKRSVGLALDFAARIKDVARICEERNGFKRRQASPLFQPSMLLPRSSALLRPKGKAW
jgi:hypothetical protein